MSNAVYPLLALALLLAGLTAVKMPDRFGEALHTAWTQGLPIFVAIPFALLAASWGASLIPPEVVGALIGANAGATGILVASVLGGLLPGGPMVAFPVAL
jgi:hypothetical protein